MEHNEIIRRKRSAVCLSLAHRGENMYDLGVRRQSDSRHLRFWEAPVEKDEYFRKYHKESNRCERSSAAIRLRNFFVKKSAWDGDVLTIISIEAVMPAGTTVQAPPYRGSSHHTNKEEREGEHAKQTAHQTNRIGCPGSHDSRRARLRVGPGNAGRRRSRDGRDRHGRTGQ